MVRLVKGAYWDSEIKRAQVAGLPKHGFLFFQTERSEAREGKLEF
jgi:RHH-type proline utilization regulon transcriptional repressor/proline dehydrogenase/delta 1-pyrroline-5-carboxylate dehydrogenase